MYWTFETGIPLNIYKVNDTFTSVKENSDINTSLLCMLDNLSQINLSYYDKIIKGTGITGTASNTGGSYSWSSVLPDFSSFWSYNGNNGHGGEVTIAYIDIGGNLKAGKLNLITNTYTNLFTIPSSDIPATTNLSANYNQWYDNCKGAEINEAGELIVICFVYARNFVTGQMRRGAYYGVGRAYNPNGSIKTSVSNLLLNVNTGTTSEYSLDQYMGTVTASATSYGRCLARVNGNSVGFACHTYFRETDPDDDRLRNGNAWIIYNGSSFSTNYTQRYISNWRPDSNGVGAWAYMVNGTVYIYSIMWSNEDNGSYEDSWVYYYYLDPLTSATTTNIDGETQTGRYTVERNNPDIFYLDYVKYYRGYSSSGTQDYYRMKTYYRDTLIQSIEVSGNLPTPIRSQNLFLGGIESKWEREGYWTTSWVQHNSKTEGSASNITAYSNIGSVANTFPDCMFWYWYVEGGEKKYYIMTNTGYVLLRENTGKVTYTHTLPTPITGIKKFFSYATLFLNSEALANYSGIYETFITSDGVDETEQNIGAWGDTDMDLHSTKIVTNFVGAPIISSVTRSYTMLYLK